MNKLGSVLMLALSLGLLGLGTSMTSCADGTGAEQCADGVDNDGDGDVDCDDPDCSNADQDVDGDGFNKCDIPELVDCDDDNADVNPQMDELCDQIDNDCNGAVDDVDLDGDGFQSQDCNGNDCDDANADVFPGNPETCDAADNDCDGEVDEGYDADDDGYTFCAGDCRDSDPLINPDATELCDDVDNNCDGDVDEAFDLDGDGFIDANDPFCADLYGPGGANEDLGDCDDTTADVQPGAHEITTDTIDNDCDTCIDECEDQDEDGWDNCAASDSGDSACAVDTDGDGVPNNSGDDGLAADCLDANPVFPLIATIVHPDIVFQVPNMEGNLVAWPEQCDSYDNNCDGTIDEGYDPKSCNPTF